MSNKTNSKNLISEFNQSKKTFVIKTAEILHNKGRYFMLKKKTLLIIPIVLVMTFIITWMTPLCVYADSEYYPQEHISAEAQEEASDDFLSVEEKK